MAVVVPVISTWDARGVNKAIADFKKLNTAGERSAFVLLNGNKAVNDFAKSFAKFGAIAAGAAGVIGGSFAKAAYESQKVMKQTEAIITATGGAAGMTAQQVADLSEKFSFQTGIDDELIQTGLNLLLTFKQVRNEIGAGNDIFNRAGKAALDLGNVFGSVDSAAVQLGKALSDPIRGITALRRSGINFTEQQQQQIKTLVESGNVLEAQKLILGEIESQVGGTAEATATGFDKMKVAIGNAQEQLGGLLIPYIEQFANYVIANVVPAVRTFTDVVGEQGLGGGINYLNGSIINGLMNMGAFGKVVLGLGAGFVALKTAVLTYTAVQGALTIAAKLTTDALRAQAIQANATRVAMLAAGGVTAVITAAASLYAIYASSKAKAEEQTRKFTEALLMEGAAQSDAFVELTKNNSQFKIMIASLGDLGLTMNDVNEFINTGTGRFAAYVAALDQVPVSAGSGIAALDAYARAANISATAFSSAGGSIAFGISELANLARSARGDAVATQGALSLLGRAGVTTGGAMAGLGKRVESAADKFKKFKDQAKSVADAQRSVRDATKATADAQKDLQKTTDAVAVAQAKLNAIASGYGAGSEQALTAQQELTAANRAAIRAQNDLEKANYAVTDAEKALREARRTGNTRDVREAEIALSEAQIAQQEAQENLTAAVDAQRAAQQRLNETINGAATTSDTYKTALTELQEAQDAQRDAIDRMRSAKERELEVTRNLVKAEVLLRKAKGGLTKAQLRKADRLLAQLNTPVTVTIPTTTGGITPLATGGIVTKPTLSLIGEGGEPEAVIPLSKMNEVTGGGITVNIQTGVGDPIEIGRQVVIALQAYQRRSGSLPLKVG